MQFAIIATLFASAAMAVPAPIVARGNVCQDLLYSVPQCCGPNVLNVASLDCRTPSREFTTGAEFSAICSEAGGAQAQCCSVPAASQGVLCIPVSE
ncbi:hypothetical protein ACHAQH_005644 [Verticillium albo-atrum]